MEEMILNPYAFFTENQETYEEAVQKSAEESQSFARTKHFRIDSPGTYTVRILPIAPTLVDGQYKLDRKGYEYPIKTQVLRLENPNSKGKKDKVFFVNVCQTRFAGLSVDLIDTYVKVAEDKYSDDEKLISKIQGSGFEGGLKWNSQRCMYMFDVEKRKDGIQMLTLSYSQYKDLEERKLTLWKKKLNKDPKHPCPISSLQMAYPVEITRKEENKKTSYSFNIDTSDDYDTLSDEEVKMLMDVQRLPDALYRYSRFHLEATIEYLKQYDKKLEIDVMSSKEIAEAIDKIKLELPADDKSHFSFDKKERNSGNDEEPAEENELDALWNRWEKLNDRGIGDKSDEGQELRDDIRTFIDENELDVRVTRNKTNQDLLENIEDAMEVAKSAESEDKSKDVSEDAEEEPESKEAEASDGDKKAEETEEEPESEQEEAPVRHARRRAEHNDDTNEPAVRPERRAARPERRRR